MKKMIYVLGAFLSISVLVLAEEMAAPMAPAPEIVSPVATNVELVNSALGSGVDRETRTIRGEATDFDSSMGVHYLTRVKAESFPTTVTHAYSVDGKEVASVRLSVKGSPWTTWSRKSVWPGEWKVELKDEAGKVIDSKEFTVSKEMAAPMETAPAQAQ